MSKLGFGLGIAGVLGFGCLLAYVTWPHQTLEVSGPPATATTLVETLGPVDPWCAPELEAIAGGACFVDPQKHGATLVVYLHGRYSPEMVAEELDRQSRLARLARARGFAVLALHGVQGECATPELENYWCWPSNERNAADGAAFATRAALVIASVREKLGPGRNVLLGFSNGGYFATLIATRELVKFDAVTIAHAGPVAPTHAAGRAVPMLLITADDDASDPDMQRLDGELSRESWPHIIIAREGGHALPDWDIDAALTFFERTAKETLPLTPALASRSHRPRVAPPPDADADADTNANANADADQ